MTCNKTRIVLSFNSKTLNAPALFSQLNFLLRFMTSYCKQTAIKSFYAQFIALVTLCALCIGSRVFHSARRLSNTSFWIVLKVIPVSTRCFIASCRRVLWEQKSESTFLAACSALQRRPKQLSQQLSCLTSTMRYWDFLVVHGYPGKV